VIFFWPHLFFSFLKNHSFQVCIGGSKSFSYDIPYGVPQAAFLSPTLYNIFSSNVPTTGVCEFATFADDTALFVSDLDLVEVCGRLQLQFDTLSDYFNNWKIRVNPTKAQAIYFTRRTSSRMLLASGIKLDDQEILWSPGLKYLVIYLDKNLTFTSHTAEPIKKG
jgi:hypothetical protein